MTFDERTIAIADKRDATHPNTVDRFAKDSGKIGVACELYFAEQFGLPYDEAEHTEHPEGDGGIDFTVQLPWRKKPLTIDVKGARKPTYLIIEEYAIHRGAEALVLCKFDDATGRRSFVGWEWRSVMQRMPVHRFPTGPNYWRPHGKLMHIDELREFFVRRPPGLMSRPK